MGLSIYAGLFGVALAGASGYQLFTCLRDDCVTTNRLTKNRRVHRRNQPGFYWTNILAIAAVTALGLVVAGLAFLPTSGIQ
jgi:hypothetical protein